MTGNRRGWSRLLFVALLAGGSAFPLPAAGFSLGDAIAKVGVPQAAPIPAAGRKAAIEKAVVVAADHLPPEVIDQLGVWAFRTWVGTHKVKESPDRPVIDRVRSRIAEAASQGRYAKAAKAFQWEVKVLEGRGINAVTFPGGKIIVYEGLLDFIRDRHKKLPEHDRELAVENDLAVVLGHEAIHALERHVDRLIGKELREKIMLAYTGKKLSDGGVDPAVAAGIMAAMGLAQDGATVMPFIREQEAEADHAGLLLTARAGYDPQVAVAFWGKRKERETPGRSLELFAAHPSTDARIQQLQGWMPEALAIHRDTDQQARAGGPVNGGPRSKR